MRIKSSDNQDLQDAKLPKLAEHELWTWHGEHTTQDLSRLPVL